MPHRAEGTVDVAGMRAAWTAAGFTGSVEAGYEDDAGETARIASVAEFRDPAAAVTAVQAHLQDLCASSPTATVLPDRSGVTMVSKHGPIMTIRVVGNAEVMFYANLPAPPAQGLAELRSWRASMERQLGTP